MHTNNFWCVTAGCLSYERERIARDSYLYRSLARSHHTVAHTFVLPATIFRPRAHYGVGPGATWQRAHHPSTRCARVRSYRTRRGTCCHSTDARVLTPRGVVARRCDKSIRNRDGHTAADVAVAVGLSEVGEFLAVAGQFGKEQVLV